MYWDQLLSESSKALTSTLVSDLSFGKKSKATIHQRQLQDDLEKEKRRIEHLEVQHQVTVRKMERLAQENRGLERELASFEIKKGTRDSSLQVFKGKSNLIN